MTSLRERLDQIANSINGGDRLDGANLYRQSLVRAQRRRALLGVVAAAAVVGTVALVPSLGSTKGNPTNAPADSPATTEPSDPPEVNDACPVGEERSVYGNDPTDGPRSVLLGCAKLGDRKVELLSDIQSGGLCLQIVGVDGRVRECGNAPSEQVPPKTDAVAAQFIAQRSDAAALEVYGAVPANVSEVILTHTHDASPRRDRAELIQVLDVAALERAGIREPFGYFLAELPPQTSRVEARALDSEGQLLGTADFEPYLKTQPRQAPISGPIQ